MILLDNNIEIHSQRQLAAIVGIQRSKQSMSRSDALVIATQLTIHGLTKVANSHIYNTRQLCPGSRVDKYLDFLDRINSNLAQYKTHEKIEENSIHAELLTFKTTFSSCENDDHLIIVFATAWNNFGISFPVLHSILTKANASILYIKNPAKGMYCTGSPEFGDSIDTLAEKLKSFVSTKGYKNVSVIGFSGAGYASLFSAGSIGADSFIGFGARTDWSETCQIPNAAGRTAPAPEDYTKNSLVNLAEHHSMNRIGKATLYYGELDSSDLLHAKNMCNLNNFETVVVKESTHNVVLSLVAEGRFEETLSNM